MIIKIESDKNDGIKTKLKRVTCRNRQRDNLYGVWPSKNAITAETVHDNCCHSFKETVILHLLFLPKTLFAKERKGLCDCYAKHV